MKIDREIIRQTSPFEKVLHTVPGFKGYYSPHLRLDSENAFREYLTGTLNSLKNIFAKLSKTLNKNTPSEIFDEYDTIAQIMDKMAHNISNAYENYAVFFETYSISDEHLQEIYFFEVSIIETGENVSSMSNDLFENSPPLKELKKVTTAVRKFSKLFRQRKKILNGVKAQ